jgi:bacillithiol biosynthesis cysteine-adding enzyme BshC
MAIKAHFNTISIPIEKIRIFNKLIDDYYVFKEKTREIISFQPNFEGIKESSKVKSQNFNQRDLLIKILDQNYQNLTPPSEVLNNIEILKKEGLAIVTAHQPNLLLGPFYTISKAISTIALCQKLNKSNIGFHYTPVFVIGSEDHDKDEILNVTLFGKKYTFDTEYQGPLGSMQSVHLKELLDLFLKDLGDHLNIEELKENVIKAFEKTTLAETTQYLLTSIFGKYGLVVLDLNLPCIKNAVYPIFQKELESNWVQSVTKKKVEWLSANYYVQAPPQDCNLFDISDGNRFKIRRDSMDDISIYDKNPERLSPNVMLRPIMQQFVLPSVAYIGGAAEVAYWLQLKDLFKVAEIPFPVILLRDIFNVIDKKSLEKWKKMGLNELDLYQKQANIDNEFVKKNSFVESYTEAQKKNFQEHITEIKSKIIETDKTLENSLNVFEHDIDKAFLRIQKKWLQAEKRKKEFELNQIHNIKDLLFKDEVMLERIESYFSYHKTYGMELLDEMIKQSDVFNYNLKLIVAD